MVKEDNTTWVILKQKGTKMTFSRYTNYDVAPISKVLVTCSKMFSISLITVCYTVHECQNKDKQAETGH